MKDLTLPHYHINNDTYIITLMMIHILHVNNNAHMYEGSNINNDTYIITLIMMHILLH